MSNLLDLPAWKVVEGIRGEEFRAEEYFYEILKRIEEKEEAIHAYITLLKVEGMENARQLDKRIRNQENIGRLAGVAIAIKDNICTKDIETTCGSHILQGFKPPYDATVISNVTREDGIILGKTNMDEFGMGSSTEHSSLGPTRNPLDLELVPGGSSGGSAAATVSGEATLSLGSDTGGSIRCPAAFCSAVGLKPTYGLVSRYGLIAYSNSLEQIGPISRSVRDTALLLNIIAGYDPLDSTSVNYPKVDYEESLNKDIKRLRIGVPKEFLQKGTDETVSKAVWKMLGKLETEGAIVEETTLQSFEYALAAYYTIAMSEASSNLSRFDGVRYGLNSGRVSQEWGKSFSYIRGRGFGSEVKRRILSGTYALSSGYYDDYYLKAQKVRTLIRKDFKDNFKRFDVLIGPTMPILPFRFGEKIEDPFQMYMCDIDTVPANLAGLPAISVPCGFHGNLSIGAQVIAPPFREDLVIQVGYNIEKLSNKNGGL